MKFKLSFIAVSRNEILFQQSKIEFQFGLHRPHSGQFLSRSEMSHFVIMLSASSTEVLLLAVLIKRIRRRTRRYDVLYILFSSFVKTTFCITHCSMNFATTKTKLLIAYQCDKHHLTSYKLE